MSIRPANGFQVWGQFTDWPSLSATARRIEVLGFASVCTNDHLFAAAGSRYRAPDAPPSPFLAGWITLAGIATTTDVDEAERTAAFSPLAGDAR